MKVILLDNIKGVGKKDEVINASDGYARNFLFPKKLAVEANAENMSKLKNKQDSVKFKRNVEKENAEKTAEELKEITLTIKVKAGDNGKIFGGVTAKEISENLKQQYNINIDKKKIVLNENIKNLGVFNISIKLFEGVVGSLKVNVITKLGYTQKSNLDYTVNLKENNYYQQKKLGKNMTYVASLIDSIDVVFDYNFTTTKPINYKYSYYVVGEVKVNSEDGKNIIFSKKENLVDEQSFTKDNSDNFSLKKNLNINYDKYNNMIKSFKSQYAINANSELVVTMYVNVTDVD